jgi:hypothetical protein
MKRITPEMIFFAIIGGFFDEINIIHNQEIGTNILAKTKKDK